jgi:transposase
MDKYFLGIDISKDKFDVCLTDGQGYTTGQFDNQSQGFKQLSKWLKKRKVKQMHACLEATGRYGEELAYHLHKAGFEVSVVNPKVSKHYAEAQMQRNKTDKLDARMLAEYCRKEEPLLWEPPTEAEMVLRALTRRLAALQKDRTREINRLKAGKHPQQVQTSMRQMIAFQDKQIAKLQEQIQDHIDQHPDLRQQQELLASIPGIGDKTAAVILGELPNISRFESVKQVTAFAGLTPEQLQSGHTSRRRGLKKMGSKHLRTALFLPALSAKHHNPLLAPFAQRLEAAGKEKMVIVGAVMRKLLHLVYGVLKSQQPFDPNYLVNVQNTA